MDDYRLHSQPAGIGCGNCRHLMDDLQRAETAREFAEALLATATALHAMQIGQLTERMAQLKAELAELRREIVRSKCGEA